MYNKLFLLPQPNPSKTPASKRVTENLPDYIPHEYGKFSPYLHEKLLNGERTYNFPLCTHNGRDHRIDAFQELIDAILYLTAHIAEKEIQNKLPLEEKCVLYKIYEAASILLTELEKSYDQHKGR